MPLNTTALVQVPPLYLERDAAAAYLALSVSTFEKLTREDSTFPKARAISGRRTGWLVDELRAWGLARPASTNLPPPNTGARRGVKVAA
jgi:prophage regulatory protein